MEIGTNEKIVMFGGIALGTGLPPLLDSFVDTNLATSAVTNGSIGYAEAYPMYFRTGVMIPLVIGIPLTLVGLFGDKWLSKHPNVQLFCLTAGPALFVNGLVSWFRGLQARQAAGVPLVFPTGSETPTNNVLARAPNYILPPAAGGSPSSQGQAPETTIVF